MSKRAAAIVAALLVLLLGAAVAGYLWVRNQSVVLTLSEAQLQQQLEQRLPFERTYLLVVRVVLHNPRVALVDGSDRLHAGLDLQLNLRLATQDKPLGGTIDVSSGIRYAADTGAFYLTDPRIEVLSLQGVPYAYTAKATEAVTRAIAEYLSSRPIYTLKATDVKQAAARLVLRDVAVIDRELVITLGL